MRLCRFFLLFCGWRVELSDTVPHDADALDFVACYALGLVDIDLLHELADDLGGQFLDVCVPPHDGEETVHIGAALFLWRDQGFQFSHSVFDIAWYAFARMVADVAPPADVVWTICFRKALF